MTTSEYAQPVHRMTKPQIAFAEAMAEQFAIEIETEETENKFERVIKYRGTGYCAEFTTDAAAIVRCPHCNEIQVCWGEYGDPETEICICSECHEDYQTEPF